jgi:hypothetical protein
MSAFFINIFQQGQYFHKGIEDVGQRFCDHFLNGLDLKKVVMHSGNAIFCNYFLAKPRFWKQWLRLADVMFTEAETSQGKLGQALRAMTRHDGQNIPMKVFIQERLASLILVTDPSLDALMFNVFDLPQGWDMFSSYQPQAIVCDALKRAYVSTGYPHYLNGYYGVLANVLHNISPENVS